MMKDMNSKMTTHNYQELSLKKPQQNKRKNKLSKQEQEQNHINGDHVEGYQWGGGGGRMGEKVPGISINGRCKIDRGRIRTVWEMEKPKNLCV